MKLDKIQKLLALANDQPDKPEGQAARRVANKYLSKLGLTEEDVVMDEALLLGLARHVWEEALTEVMATVHPVNLHQVIDSNSGLDNLLIRGRGVDVKLVSYRFTTIRRSVLKLAGDYHRKLNKVVPHNQIHDLVEVFCNYVVLALSERILSEDIEDEQIDIIVDAEDLYSFEEHESESEVPLGKRPENQKASSSSEDLGSEPGEDGQEEFVPESFYDTLLDYTANRADKDFGLGALDPCVCGYNAGLEVSLSSSIPSESDTTLEEARRLVKTMGLIGSRS